MLHVKNVVLTCSNIAWVRNCILLKFIYSEKATKFEEIFHLGICNVKTRWDIFSKKLAIFSKQLAFSENLNFTR